MATKRNALGVLMGIELVLNGAMLNFIAFGSPYLRNDGNSLGLDGQLMALFVIVLAAAEAAVALAIVLTFTITTTRSMSTAPISYTAKRRTAHGSCHHITSPLMAAWLLPLASFVLIVLFGKYMGHHGKGAGYLAVLAIVTSALFSLIAMFGVWLPNHAFLEQEHHGEEHGESHADASVVQQPFQLVAQSGDVGAEGHATEGHSSEGHAVRMPTTVRRPITPGTGIRSVNLAT